MKWRKMLSGFMAAALVLGSVPAFPVLTVQAEQTVMPEGFVLYDGENTAPVFMDEQYEASEKDPYAQRSYTQVARAVGDFRQDVGMVTGAVDAKEVQSLLNDSPELQQERLEEADSTGIPALYTQLAEGIDEDYAVIIGTIGDSEIIGELMDAGKLDEAKEIEDNWESYVIKVVENPVPGVGQGLIIAGSDARGTIYGIYEISEKMGVSPFYWYSDVPVETQEQIILTDLTEQPIVNDGPDVKYRGIFINDEDISILNWAADKFEDEEVPGVNYYRHIFELLLRLKCNFLWPAMHEVSDAFNTEVNDQGIPVDSAEASRYGIVMGSSHCEIMLRANTSEWAEWYEENKDKYHMTGSSSYDAYDFSKNEEGILQYWRERLETNKEFESVLTLGIRGVHDGAFNCDNLSQYEGNTTAEKQVSFMEDVIKKQRQLIAEVYFDGDMSRISEVPQVLIPYKEMATVYNNGLNTFMAQEEYWDVTLMWAEDNFGYVRQVPTSDEAARAGGTGIYYHSSYYGTPSCYLWLNSTPLAQLSEQLHRAYDCGIRNQWVLNVGDLKPGDQQLEFYAKMAWDTEKYTDETVKEMFQIPQAMRDYHMDRATAQKVADIMEEYYKIIAVKKPEFYTVSSGGYPLSVTANGDEALLWLERCREVANQMTEIYETLSPEYQTAFYEQMYYHVLSMKDAAEEYVYYWKALQAAEQGRAGSLRIYTALSKAARNTIRNRVKDYDALNGGKWEGYMSWQHVDAGGREDYSHDILQDSDYPTLASEGSGIGAAAEGQETAGEGTLRFNSLSEDTRYFDVFSKKVGAARWVAETSGDWILLSKAAGSTATEERVTVTIDWTKVEGTQNGSISVYQADENGEKTSTEPAVVFSVEAVKKAGFDYQGVKGYVEANGYVMLEAEHYSESVTGADNSQWQLIKANGQRGDTMKAMPNTAAYTENYEETAKLIYNVYFEKAGTYSGTLYRLPTLNEGKDDDGRTRSCRTGIGVAGSTPTILRGNSSWQSSGSYNSPDNAWAKNIMRMYEPLSFKITVQEGWNQIVVYRMDTSIVFDRILIETEDGAVADSLLGPTESPNNISEWTVGSAAQIPDEITSAMIFEDMELTEGDAPVLFETEQTVINAVSSEERVAAVSVQEGKLYITPVCAGAADISVEGENGTFFFGVRVLPDQNATGYYVEKDGLAVIQASNALGESKEAYTTESDKGHSWVLSGMGIQVLPDIGSIWTDGSVTGLEGKSPSVTYKIWISNEGDYRLYANTSNPDVNSDSYHVVVDGQFCYTDTNGSGGTATGAETWYGGNKTINLTEGAHTITIYAREDGFKLNQLALTMGEKPSELYGQTSEREDKTDIENVVVKVEAEDSYRLSDDGMKLDGAWSNSGASNGKWLKLIASKNNAYVTMSVSVPRKGTYRIEICYRTDTSGRAVVQPSVDGKKLGDTIDMNGASGAYVNVELGEISLAEGDHEITLSVVNNKGTTIGLDYVTLTRTGGAEAAEEIIPVEADKVLLEEDFEDISDTFGFASGSYTENGVLYLTHGMKDDTTSVKKFSEEIAVQTAVELTFDWTSELSKNQGKTGITFRDAYGRLLFALCGTYSNGYKLRYSAVGGALEPSKLVYWYEPVWSAVELIPGEVYTIHLKADFLNGLVSYDITQKSSGKELARVENAETEATGLAQMIACSYYTANGSYPGEQTIDNFILCGSGDGGDFPLKEKTLYAFGDSIVYGHQYHTASFPNFVADKEGMVFSNNEKFGVNGATITKSNNQILSQIIAAPEEAPDYVILEGGINDAYDSTVIGEISSITDWEQASLDTLDETSFAGAFEKTLLTIKKRWPSAQILYVAVHKTNTREKSCQEKLYRMEMQICSKWNIKVADIYSIEEYDCLNQPDNVIKYAFDAVGSNGLPVSNGNSATHPNLDAIEKFYVPAISEALRELAMEAELQRLKDLVAEKEEELKGKEELLQAKLQELESAERELGEAEAEVLRLSDELEAERARVNELDKELSDAQTRLEELEKNAEISAGEMEELNTRIAELQEQLSEAQGQAEELTQAITAAQNEIIQITAEKEKLQQEVEKAKEEAEQAREAADEAKAEAEQEKERADSAQREKEEALEALKKAQEDLEAARASQAVQEPVLKKGDTEEAGGIIYRVTNADKKQAEAYGVTRSTVTAVKVADTVVINSVTCTVTSIAANAFKSLPKLKKAVIGKNVSTIGKKAFYGDKKLKTIQVKAVALKKVGKASLKNISAKAVIKVPISKKKAYKKLFKGKGQKKTVKIK